MQKKWLNFKCVTWMMVSCGLLMSMNSMPVAAEDDLSVIVEEGASAVDTVISGALVGAEEVMTEAVLEQCESIDVTYVTPDVEIVESENVSINDMIEEVPEPVEEDDASASDEILIEDEPSVEEDAEDTWDGPVLTASKGVNQGPSGKETYYNLDMSGIVRGLQRGGWIYQQCVDTDLIDSILDSDGYWVRDDGCKMFGDYIMVAANLSVHPRGSLVPTSLGTGIVVDTGGFAKSNPNQLDIATNW